MSFCILVNGISIGISDFRLPVVDFHPSTPLRVKREVLHAERSRGTTPDIIVRPAAFATKKGFGALWQKESNFQDFYYDKSTCGNLGR
jgi:hypothetical protein